MLLCSIMLAILNQFTMHRHPVDGVLVGAGSLWPIAQ
jgi:hypothetical protein